MAQALDRLGAARDAADLRDWQRAYELLLEQEAEQPLRGDALELLVETATWARSTEAALPHLETAYMRHLEDGDVERAAWAAVTLGHEYGSVRLQRSIGSGWLARAARLLEGRPEGRTHGWLALEQALVALSKSDLETALERGAYAERVGRESGDRAIEVRGMQRRGMALIALGDVAEGKLLLDEASAAALGGELDPYSTLVVYCNTIGACRDVSAFDQAGEWADRASAFCDEISSGAFPGMCQINRAEVMRFKGRLEEAEATATEAFSKLREWAPRIAAGAMYEIGEVRLRLGDLTRAEESFDEADERGRDPEPGRSLLLLARGKTASALAGIRRALADDRLTLLDRGRLLPAHAEIALAAGEVDEAAAAAVELRSLADRYDTPALDASAGHAEGAVLLARGDGAGAASRLRRALRLWQEVHAAYEAGRTRELLGLAFRAEGDEEAGAHELAAAAAAFDRLGARLDAERVAAALGRETGTRVRKTFLFTDIVDSTRTVEAVGDEKWARALRWHDDTFRQIVRTNEGEVVDHTGDGFFVAFDSPAQAVGAAAAFQRALAAQPLAPDVRIGLHADEATHLGADYRGRGVHVAARVGAVAQAREIVATAETVEPLPGVRASAPREVELKGLSEPVAVVSIDWS